jgi:hypothetical protein
MSAPTTQDPQQVTTRDGAKWIRRAVDAQGRGLYALEGSCECPEFLLATLAELAEHGIKGQPLAAAVASLGALPLPVAGTLLELLGDAQPARDGIVRAVAEAVRDRRAHDHDSAADWDWYCLNLSGYIADRAGAVLRRLLDAEVERDALRARVAELEAAAGDGATRTVDEDPIAYALTEQADVTAHECLACGEGLDEENISDFCSDRCESVGRLRGLLARQRAGDMPQAAAEMLADRLPTKGAS